MAKQKPPQHKKRSSSPNKQLEAAIANDDGSSYSTPNDGSHTTRVCYNRACPDYRRERSGDEDCACKRTTIAGESS